MPESGSVLLLPTETDTFHSTMAEPGASSERVKKESGAVWDATLSQPVRSECKFCDRLAISMPLTLRELQQLLRDAKHALD